jgi:hypothetical protein
VLVLATFLTVHFGDWQQKWHGTGGLAKVGESAFDSVPRENEGALAALDPDSGECLWACVLDTPAGFALTDEHIYVNSMYGNRITVLSERLEVVNVLARWFMTDLHSLTVTDSGFLVTSSGVDAVVEVTASGEEVWGWFATDRAYRIGHSGVRRKINRGRDHRQDPISTHDQATHCNSAILHRAGGHELALVTLFHQGELIAVDRGSGKHSVLVSGMNKPHSVRKAPSGWLVCDSRGDGVVLLDEDFWISAVVTADFDWVQDAVPNGGQLIVADANHSRLVWWDLAQDRQAEELSYSGQWKIYQIEVVEGPWERRLRQIASGGVVGRNVLAGDSVTTVLRPQTSGAGVG